MASKNFAGSDGVVEWNQGGAPDPLSRRQGTGGTNPKPGLTSTPGIAGASALALVQIVAAVRATPPLDGGLPTKNGYQQMPPQKFIYIPYSSQIPPGWLKKGELFINGVDIWEDLMNGLWAGGGSGPQDEDLIFVTPGQYNLEKVKLKPAVLANNKYLEVLDPSVKECKWDSWAPRPDVMKAICALKNGPATLNIPYSFINGDKDKDPTGYQHPLKFDASEAPHPSPAPYAPNWYPLGAVDIQDEFAAAAAKWKSYLEGLYNTPGHELTVNFINKGMEAAPVKVSPFPTQSPNLPGKPGNIRIRVGNLTGSALALSVSYLVGDMFGEATVGGGLITLNQNVCFRTDEEKDNNCFSLRRTFAHELGHILLGLEHPATDLITIMQASVAFLNLDTNAVPFTATPVDNSPWMKDCILDKYKCQCPTNCTTCRSSITLVVAGFTGGCTYYNGSFVLTHASLGDQCQWGPNHGWYVACYEGIWYVDNFELELGTTSLGPNLNGCPPASGSGVGSVNDPGGTCDGEVFVWSMS